VFVRKVKSRNSICFQIGYKSQNRFVLVKHVGCAANKEKIEALKIKAQQELFQIQFKKQLSLFSNNITSPKAKLVSWKITGFHQTFGKAYDFIGFTDSILKDIVVTRIVCPKSKMAMVRYMNKYLGILLKKDKLFRFLDALDKDTLTKTAFDFVLKETNGISIVFYDVTTLYFETDKEDALRAKGYSKDHRHDLPQILIGLFVDRRGYPFDFEFFKGSTFEGHTFQKATNQIIRKYNLNNFVAVADAGMLSQKNINFLVSKNLSYIVGARIKNLPNKLIEEILTHDFRRNNIYETRKGQERLIISYSEKRAKRNRASRVKSLEKLKLKLKNKNKLIRKSKYLLVGKGTKILGLNKDKIKEDEKFDGLRGYFTNLKVNSFKSEEIIEKYHHLWKVEKAFRISKSDLCERPVFHRNIKRIESHLLICFVSLLVIKVAEDILKHVDVSMQRAIEVLGKVGQGQVNLGKIQLDVDSELDDEAKAILDIFSDVLGH